MSHLTRAMRLIDMLRRLRVRAYTTEELAGIYRISQRRIQEDLQDLGGYPQYAALMCKVVWSIDEVGVVEEEDS